MNIVNFNQNLIKDVTCLLSPEAVKAPLFVSNDISDEKTADAVRDYGAGISNKIWNGIPVLPFPSIRVHMECHANQKAVGMQSFKIWAEQTEKKLRAVIEIPRRQKDEEFNPFIYLDYLSSDIWFFGFHTGDRWLSNEEMAEADKLAKAQGVLSLTANMNAYLGSLLWFSQEAMSPANFKAEVIPKKKGKSVEWLKARTHYVLVHKKHPANNKNVASGQNVQIDSSYKAKQAHTRRAHSRILRSPKFKNKVGQTITVRSCWVGPKEWEQNGSIYRLC